MPILGKLNTVLEAGCVHLSSNRQNPLIQWLDPEGPLGIKSPAPSLRVWDTGFARLLFWVSAKMGKVITISS